MTYDLFEQNYLNYPVTVKEAVGEKIYLAEKKSNEPLPEVDVILKGLVDESFPLSGYKYELTSTFNSKNSSNLVRITETLEQNGALAVGQSGPIVIIPGDYEFDLDYDELKGSCTLYLKDFKGVSIGLHEEWTDPDTGEHYPAQASLIVKVSGVTPHFDPTVPIIDPGSSSGQPPKQTQP